MTLGRISLALPARSPILRNDLGWCAPPPLNVLIPPERLQLDHRSATTTIQPAGIVGAKQVLVRADAMRIKRVDRPEVFSAGATAVHESPSATLALSPSGLDPASAFANQRLNA